MNTKEIATRLAELCRQGQFETAQKELFAEDVVSIESFATPDFEKETKGLEAIIQKGHKFEAMTQSMHSLSVSEPILAAQSFALTLRMDITMKGKERMDMTELCVYKLKDGKIISEEFFM
ncbi:MAG: SnoaL-like domain-containing protein [Ferruginibacter sp.]